MCDVHVCAPRARGSRAQRARYTIASTLKLAEKAQRCRAVPAPLGAMAAKQLASADHHDEIDQVEANCLAQLTVLKDDHHECANDSAKCSKSSFDNGVEQLKNHCDLRHDLSDLDSESSVLMQRRDPFLLSVADSQELSTSLGDKCSQDFHTRL